MQRWTWMVLVGACGGSPAPEQKTEVAQKIEEPAAAEAAPAFEVPQQHLTLFKAIERTPVTVADKDRVELGRMLYYDKRLSKSQQFSCNSCHMLDNFGVDGEPTSPGHNGQRGDRNSPTVYNAGGHVAQFWDGRAKDLADQAKGPILNPVEMAMPSETDVEKLLASIPGYEAAFAKAFPDQAEPVNYDNMATAIGTFEQYLVTPSAFDRYLAGDGEAMTAEQRAGLDVFISTGCTACHNGALLGGTTFMKLGAVVPYETADIGRAKVTGNDADKYVFKVPSLRNVAKTAPYLHDGSIATLPEMVRLMAKHQLGRELSDEDVASIVTFLDATTGEIDKAYIAQPTLPPNGPETPGPT